MKNPLVAAMALGAVVCLGGCFRSTTATHSANPYSTAGDAPVVSSEARLSQQIRTAIKNDQSLTLPARDVSVTTTTGVVTLSGHVSSELEKVHIANTAQRLAGNEYKINNQLDVLTP